MRADACGGCGESLSESLHVDGRPDPVYQAGYAVCLACKAREVRQQEVQDNDKKRNVKVYEGSRHWVVLRKPD